MKPDASFQQMYQEKLVPVLESLEKTRKEAVKPFWTAILWLLAIIPVFFVSVQAETPWVMVAGIVPLVLAVLQFADHGKKKKEYTETFKKKVIREIVMMMNPELVYTPQSSISVAEYEESDLFRFRVDSYAGDDLVTGKLGRTDMRFSELCHKEKRVSYNSKGHRQETWVTIFKGIFFVADFNKHFNGKTYVLPDAGSDFLGIGKFFEKWKIGRGELVKLENPDFENLFTVYGNDQVEARYILSPALMQRLVEFSGKANTDLHISFLNSKVFIAVSIEKDLFEPHVFSSGIKADYLYEYFHYLDLVTGIVEDLNLNTRIWGKE
jgi:hypothetical protein